VLAPPARRKGRFACLLLLDATAGWVPPSGMGIVPLREIVMAKGQKRSGREPKKPKASKLAKTATPQGFGTLRPERPLPAKAPAPIK
jgi:hypothetical protein